MDSGIGKSIEARLIEIGASVAIADLNAEQLELARHEVGARGMVVGNITAESDCNAMVANAGELCDGLDAVVNAAGVSDRVGPALGTEMEAWQRVVDIHLRGASQFPVRPRVTFFRVVVDR